MMQHNDSNHRMKSSLPPRVTLYDETKVQFGCGYLETAPEVRDHWYQCYHFWYFNMTTDVMFSDKFLTFSRQTWCWLDDCFCFPHLDSRFLISFHQFLTLVCVWLSFQTKEALFAALRLTFYVNYKWYLHSMAILRSVSDLTRVIALC